MTEPVDSTIGECFYFGCDREPGHLLFAESRRRVSSHVERNLPFRFDILDGGLLPTSNDLQAQGVVHVSYIGGFTILSFWDRSVDNRFASNSSFLIPANVYPQQAIRIARQRFPWVVERFSFQLLQSSEQTPFQAMIR